MTLDPLQIVLGLALALGVGGLVGLERERHAHEHQKSSIGGARTFPLLALLGALSAVLAHALGGLVFFGATVAVAFLLGLGYQRIGRGAESVQHGLTTEFAALLVFAIGALPFLEVYGLEFEQRLLLGAALGTVVMTLLALRQPIHRFAEGLSREDLLATVRFALVAVVALPLLPDRGLGPFGALNPFRIGVVIVLIAGISFTGYIAVRLFGARRGIGVTALAGGLVSSTAVTLTFSEKGRTHPTLTRACALAVVLAATIMFVRVLVEILAIQPALVAPALVPLGSMLGAGAAGCLLLWRRAARLSPGDEPSFENPFRLRQALRLGLVYAVVRLVAVVAWTELGSGGLYVSSALSGLADVDAITISVARMHEEGLETHVAVGAVTIAVVSNTVVKAGLAVALGGRRLAVAVVSVLIPTAGVGILVAWLAG